jgi:hypothetical protein
VLARDGSVDLRALRQARDELERRLLAPVAHKAALRREDGSAGLGNIVGIGIGVRLAGGVATGRPAIKIFVAAKRPRRAIAAEALVPRWFGGIPTDVETAGEVRAHRFMRRYRPAPSGVSIGRESEGGSLACFVKRSGATYILGNNHVLALVNRGPAGTGIAQPAEIDGGARSGDVIARLSRFVPISFDDPNEVDAALARLPSGMADRRVLRAGGKRQALLPPEIGPALGQEVQKSGRSTGYRRGRIDAIAVTIDVDFAPLGTTARFVNQFGVRGRRRSFSDHGDSGALVTTWPSNQPVGLLFSGCTGLGLAFCNDIRKVTKGLGVSIVY